MTGAISYLTQEQIQSLLDSILSIRDRAIFTVAYWRGLRVSEVGALRVEDYRPVARRLFVRRVKGGTSAEYVISPQETRALDNWLKVRGTDPGPLFVARGSNPISRQRLHNLMVSYSTQLGFPEDRRHFHCLRHSIATHLVGQGMDIMLIRDWLGHRDIASTMVYAKVMNPVRDKASEKLYAAFGAEEEAPPWVGKGGGEKSRQRPASASLSAPVASNLPPKVRVRWEQDGKGKAKPTRKAR